MSIKKVEASQLIARIYVRPPCKTLVEIWQKNNLAVICEAFCEGRFFGKKAFPCLLVLFPSNPIL